MPDDLSRFERLARKIDPRSRLIRAWSLTGGLSAQVTALELAQPDGETRKVVVRQHGAVDLGLNPHVAADEYRLLTILKAAGLPVPAAYGLDDSGEIFTTPVVVEEFIDGQPDFAPLALDEALGQLAALLARIHSVDGSARDLSFLPNQQARFTDRLRRAAAAAPPEAQRIRDALERIWPLPQRNATGLLHGDFWPGNVLWKDGALAAVIDWENAPLGDPLADVGNARLELLWAYGVEDMQRFTDLYRARTSVDVTDLPYWDLCAALHPATTLGNWRLDPATEQAMQADLRRFIDWALGRVDAP